uniref:Uncharacterized protein n=1 Tax=Escherichia coli TaxID=562 RepID=A0A075M9E4_ECOLX|nr:hypothetical protein [Escherichia coli]
MAASPPSQYHALKHHQKQNLIHLESEFSYDLLFILSDIE